MKKVKITVLKKEFYEDLAQEYGKDCLGPCALMEVGQEFIADRVKPEGLCDGAWRCIHQYVFALANGAGQNGFFYDDWCKEPGVAISCCNDGFRPVIFKLEVMDEDCVKDF